MCRPQMLLKSLLLATALLGESRVAWAYDIGYGGRLAAADGAPMAGPLNLVFHFYRSETNPTPTLSLAKASVPLVDGMFQVSLSLSPDQLDSLMGDGSEKIYIEVEALGRRYPKQVFSYVPLALRVPVDDDSIIFSNGRLAVGSIGPSQVQGLSAALAAKADATTLTAGLLGKANSSHNHTTADITDLASILSTKASTNAPLVGDVTGTLTGSVVSSIRGTGIPAPNTAADSGKFVQYNGTSFVYTAIAGSSGGTVTNVSATSPLSVSNGTTVPVLAISQASPFASGYLSAADFGTFNSKQDAISTASTLDTGTVTTSQQRGLELKPYGTGTGELRFGELAANGPNYVGFKAPDALTVDKVWTLPTTDGAPGQVLKTDGQGNLSWAAGLSPADTAVTNAPSTIVMRDGSGNFTAGTITAAIVGNVTGNVSGNVTGTADNVTGTVSVANGGTGLTSGTAGGLPYFATSTSLASTAALGDGQLLIGSAGGAPVPATLTQGATAGVTIASGAGSIALDTAQDIRATASPTFAGLNLGNGSLAAGTVAAPVLVAGSQDASSTATSGLLRGAAATGEDVTGPDLSIAAGNGTGTGGSGKIQFLTAAAGEAGSTPATMVPRVTIDQNGKMGIGTTTPESLLHLLTPDSEMMAFIAESSHPWQTQMFIENGSSNASWQLLVGGSGNGTGAAGVGGFAIYGGKDPNYGFRLNINANGNVGIGTTAPANLFSVNGSANFTGNVGIGSTAPTQPLDVAGTIRSSTGGFMFPDGSMMSSALPTPSSGYSSTTDLNMSADFGANGTGILAMSTRGTERLRITNAGNIGIGSTAPGTKMDVVSGAAASGLRVLSGSAANWTGYALGRTTTEATLGIAAGASSLTTGSAAGDIVLRSETSSQRLMFSNGTGSPSMSVGNGGVAIGSYAASDLAPTSGLIVSGSLGVGTNAPSQPLEVAGIIKSSAGGFMFPDGSIMTSAATPGISGTSSTSDLNLVADSAAAGTGDAILSTKGTERMRVSNAGNIGIGTSAPGDRLMIRSTKDSTVTPQLPGLAVVDSSLANQGVGGGIALWGNYTGTTPISGATIHAMKAAAAAGDTGFNLAFNTRVNGGGLTEKMRITSTGNVGIGMVTPGSKLQVNGGAAIGYSGSTAAPATGLIVSGNVGIGTTAPLSALSLGPVNSNIKLALYDGGSSSNLYGIGANSGNLTFIAGASATRTPQMVLSSGGNVGIGTTAPTHALDVNGVVRSSGGFMFSDGTMMTTAATSSSSSSGGTSSETTLTLAADTSVSGTGVIALNTAGVEQMRITNDGNVGIGTATPVNKLSVNGTSNFIGNVGIGTTTPVGTLHLSRVASNTPGEGLLVFGNSSPLFAWRNFATNWNLALDRSWGGTWTEVLTVDRSNGYVGIGTTGPTNLLDLSRGSSGSSTDQLILRNAGTTTTANTGAGLAFALTSASTARHAAINAVVSNAATGGTDLTLSTHNGTSVTEKLRIKAGGFVGIGTSSPANQLSVAGGADFTGNVGIGSNIPARALDVVGVVRASAGIEFPDGTTMTTAAAAGTGTSSITDLSFAADSDADGSGVISFATRGSERIRIENTGNVGFGTPTPLSRVAINGGLAVGTYAGANAAPTSSMIISGNIGIGSTSPAVKLDVATSGAGLQTAARMQNAVTAALNSGAQTMFAANRTTSGLTDIAAVGGIITDITSGAYKGALILSTANNSTPAERVRIDSSGNVGIGTTSPVNSLSVNGTANITGNVGIGTTTASQPLEVAGSIKLSSAGSLIFPDGTSMSTAAVASTGSASTTDLAFSADSDGDGTGVLTMATRGTERMRLDSNGNLGIGTIAPTARLTLQTTSGLDGINLVSGASSSSPAYSLYDGATERGVFGLATAAGQRSTSAAAGDIVLRATAGNLLLQTGTADATVVLSNGNVGIGTTMPGALLDVSGARFGAPTLTGAYIGLAGPTWTDNVTAASATATNMAFNAIASPTLAATNTGVTTTNAYTAYIGGAPRKGTNNTVTNAVALGIGAAAVTGQTNSYGLLVNAQTGATNNYAAIFQGGNVGIGSAAPTQRLDVAGAIRSSSGGFVFPDGTVMTTAITATTGGTSSTTDLNLAADTEGTGSGAVIVSTGTVERMRVVNSGNIGINTSLPGSSLEVNGGIRVRGGAPGTSGINNNGYAFSASSGDTDSGMFSNGDGVLQFFTNNAERMRINSSGNVGIGTTGPSTALDIRSGTNDAGQIRLGTTGQAGKISFARSSDGAHFASVGYSGTSAILTFSNIGGGSAFNWTMSGGSEVMRIDTTGNIGIGTTAPGSRLQVNGNAAIGYSSATAAPTNGLAVSGNLGIGTITPGYKLDVVGDINTTTCMRIAGTQQLGTCASDERFKKNITPITGALAKLRLLSPVHYEFRTDEFPSRNFSREVEAGLIAQELEQVFPHLVVTDDDGYKRVRYGLDLNMQIIAAVKELALENDQLKAETVRRRARDDRADAEVARLKTESAALKAESEILKAEAAEMRAFLCGQFPSAPMCFQ